MAANITTITIPSISKPKPIPTAIGNNISCWLRGREEGVSAVGDGITISSLLVAIDIEDVIIVVD